jgi:hypothetical protein
VRIDRRQDFPARLSIKQALSMVGGLVAHNFSKLVVAAALALAETGAVTALTNAFIVGLSISS